VSSSGGISATRLKLSPPLLGVGSFWSVSALGTSVVIHRSPEKVVVAAAQIVGDHDVVEPDVDPTALTLIERIWKRVMSAVGHCAVAVAALVEHGDHVGEDEHGRVVMQVAVEPWIFDALCLLGADTTDMKPEDAELVFIWPCANGPSVTS
jgi:hypothetical protein